MAPKPNPARFVMAIGMASTALALIDPPPLKWSDLRYVFDIKED